MLHSVRVLFSNNMTFLVVAQQIYTKTAAKYHSLNMEPRAISIERCDYTMHMWFHMWFENVHPITSQLEYSNNFDIGHKIFIRYIS